MPPAAERQPDLSVCVCHRARAALFRRSAESIAVAAAATGIALEIRVAHWPTTPDQEINAWLHDLGLPVAEHHMTDRPFSRGAGRAAAAAGARAEVLAFLDADMLVPPRLLVRGLEVVAGGAAFFPGYFRQRGPQSDKFQGGTGHGNCFLSRAQYAACDPWPRLPRWGAEDTSFARWFTKQGLYVREYIPGFIHQWHLPAGRQARPRIDAHGD